MKRIEDALKEFGFDCTKATDGFVVSFFFRRRKEYLDEIIIATGKKYKTDFSGHNCKMEIPRPCISFPEVETLIGNAMEQPTLDFYTITRNVSHDVVSSGIDGLRLDNNMVEVNTDEETERYITLLSDVYKQYAMPFYDQFNSLQKIDDYLTSTSNDKDRKLISNSGGNSSMYRMFIIKYLCKNPDAEKYHSFIRKEFQEKMSNKTIASMYKVFCKIEEALGLGE
jgi:hypothetical protein